MGDNVGGPVVIVPTFTVTINPMEDDEVSACQGITDVVAGFELLCFCARNVKQPNRSMLLPQMTYVPPSPPDHLSPAKHKNRCKDADLANGNDVVRVS